MPTVVYHLVIFSSLSFQSVIDSALNNYDFVCGTSFTIVTMYIHLVVSHSLQLFYYSATVSGFLMFCPTSSFCRKQTAPSVYIVK